MNLEMVFFRTLVVIMANPIRKITLKFSQTKYICTEMWHQKCPSIQCCTTQARGLRDSMAGKGPSPAFLPPPPSPLYTHTHTNLRASLNIQCCTEIKNAQAYNVALHRLEDCKIRLSVKAPIQLYLQSHASRNKSMWLNVDRSVEGKVHGFSWSARLVRQFLLRGCPIDYEPIANSTFLKRGK